ncbi:MAG TPA: PHB depolymerase family esterase [Allosphingosinicella sp.]|jgi:poly(hydroxyalkanoate) depolymerase family esterase
MRGIADKMKKAAQAAAAAPQAGGMNGLGSGLGGSVGAGRLRELEGVKSNPGKLRGLFYVPEGLGAGAPLVVVLHGCTQDATGYDRHSGWSRLAERHGFALLFPEQSRSNNPNLCFNWYAANHSQRGMGEAASIKFMVDAMRRDHHVDPAKIFITGLSAGGAMAMVMLATYPEVFSAGAIIAGIPYGCANGVAEAFDCMGGRARSGADELAARVRRASPNKGKWPRVSVWQGSEDRTVVPSNADAIVLQWAALHGLGAKPDRTETVEGYPRRIWNGADGKPVLEHYAVTGMAHGTPLDPGTQEGQSGMAGAHMLDVGLSSTDRIAAFFGIAPEPQASAKPAAKAKAEAPAQAAKQRRRAAPRPRAAAAAPTGVQKVIEDALRAAGLMR